MSGSTRWLICVVVMCLGALALVTSEADASPSSATCAAMRVCKQGYVSIRGIDQWIWIAGKDAHNPASTVPIMSGDISTLFYPESMAPYS